MYIRLPDRNQSLDCADVLDFEFMRRLRRETESLKPDFWLMGEVIHGDYSRWVAPGMLHSVTNYELHKARTGI